MTLSVHLHLSLTQLFGRVIKASIAIDNGRAAEFIRRRNYFDKSKCYECGVSKPRTLTLLQYKVFLVLLIFDAHQWGTWGEHSDRHRTQDSRWSACSATYTLLTGGSV